MYRHFIIVLLLLQSGFLTSAQKIDDLKKVLRLLQDTARVDGLNELGFHYLFNEKRDSAEYFSTLAFKEAKTLNYTHGLAVSLSCQSQIAKHFDDDFIKTEQLANESLSWFEKTPNKAGLDTLYANLIYTVFAQSKFDEALLYTGKLYGLAKLKNDPASTYKATNWMFGIYRQSGNYEKSFLYAQKKYEMASKAKNRIWLYSALYSIAQLYALIEDFPSALVYFRKCRQMDDEETRKWLVTSDNDIWFKMEFTEVFSNLGQFDSAWHYYRLFKPGADKTLYTRVWWVSTGECYLLQKDYIRALHNLKLGLAEHRKLNDQNEVIRALLDIGKAYLSLNDNLAALKYGREGLQMGLQTKAKQYTRDGYQILSTVYDRLHQPDSANFYFRQYARMKEEVLNDRARAKFAAYQYEQHIAVMNREKEMHRAHMQKEASIKKLLIAGILLLALLGLIIVRNIALKRRNEKQQLEHQLTLQKLESERAKAEFQQQASELQMQALRAQMNPHFIFNSLNSINRFILKNQRREATEYLTKFSRLIRMVLNGSANATVTLTEDKEALKLYLELESLRFDNQFTYEIQCDPDVDADFIQVPPLLLQPFVENAIWHGLMHKEGEGHVWVNINQEDKTLVCTVTDDGIGRKKAAELKSKSAAAHKSMGMRITAERIASLQQKHAKASVHVNDLMLPNGGAGGTEVIIKIPVVYG